MEDELTTDNYNSIPGTQKVHVITFGCSHNISDSEFMMGLLQDYGYSLVATPEEADLVLMNSCTVKNPSEQALMNKVFKFRNTKKPIVVAGCVPQGQGDLEWLKKVSIIGTTQIDRVVEVVEETLRGNVVRLLEKKALPRLDLPKIRKNRFIEIIPINTGCLGNCTYCKTKHARGVLGSYDPEEIVLRVRRAIREGVKQIWITSEDTGAYGLDIGTTIAELLLKIVKELPPGVMLRVGMTNPPYILDHLESMSLLLQHPNVFQFLHIPVQSGSNRVLEKMNREYTREDFEKVVDYISSRIPDFTIMTDIICGFPGESESDHLETASLIRKYKFRAINISQFYPRQGTVAAKMKQLDSRIKKQRSREITDIFNSYSNSDDLVGTVQRV